MFNRSLFLLGLLWVPLHLRAADQPSPELKLRETLRNTMLQLRTAQGERDALQVEKTQLEQEKLALTQERDALAKKSATEQAAAEKLQASQAAKLADLETAVAQLRGAVEQWKAAQQKAAALAEARETARARAALEVVELRRITVDQRTRNAEMYRIGMEVVNRFEGFGLGTALSAREPFIGTTRVKLQNLVQDYSDKLMDQRIKPAVKPVAKP